MSKPIFRIVIWVLFILLLLATLMHFLSAPRRPRDTNAFWQRVKKERMEAAQDTSVPQKNVWYKNGFIYTLDVEVFKDSDGDGVGDFNGLTQKLSYIRSLGTDIIWLAPFQPTANKDDGYDITDYYSIDPRLGTMDDFKNFVHAANKRGMRVIIDLVFNHTSDQHPWFLQSANGHMPLKDWYVWSYKRPANEYKGIMFEGVQKDIWTLNAKAHAYYYHRFYDFEPDLNMENKMVRAELNHVMNFWLNTGISGFRIDAVTYLIERPKTTGTNFKHDYKLLETMRKIANVKRTENILLGEANVPEGKEDDFFGSSGQSLNLIFNFNVDQRTFYALATGEIETLKQALQASKKIPYQCSWVYFLRNQDEMGMGRFSDKEKRRVFEAFAPQYDMQLYNRGVRRRLAPMFNNNQRKLKMAYSLLFALPGIPMLRYGDEIGMGDDLSLKERMAVRTPMQWTDGENAGFSTTPATVRPIIRDGDYAYEKKNVHN